MIYLEIEIKGEPDVPPFTRVLEFNNDDEIIFSNSVEMVKEKISRNMKINTNEAMMVFCSYLVSEIRSGKTVDTIQENSSKILSHGKVMIGVPETLRRITFEVVIDNQPKKIIIFNEPIPTSSQVL
ncbi:MAG: urease subunit gamma [Thaumarchaeota archaeon]|nr:urease subunit gamma [Nitrososphaerota archaeon]MBI3640848.1 urease subunit gamma [Nitrososphaerota archaeon]